MLNVEKMLFTLCKRRAVVKLNRGRWAGGARSGARKRGFSPAVAAVCAAHRCAPSRGRAVVVRANAATTSHVQHQKRGSQGPQGPE